MIKWTCLLLLLTYSIPCQNLSTFRPARLQSTEPPAGEPKAIPWTHVTPLRCAADSWAHLDLHPRDVLAWPTSLG